MTTSSLSRLEQILQTAEPTTDARSEQMLSVALGYPLTWHVVRLPDRTDVIYAGNPSRQKNLALWFNHDAARRAAEEWDPNTSSPYRGGHLLPREPRFRKNDSVEVLYEGEWFPAKIVKRKDYEDEYRYTVNYTDEDTTQEDVEEEHIRPGAPDAKAVKFADSLGFPEGWKAYLKGKRYHITSPDGMEFKNKRSAVEYLEQLGSVDDGDPPWRTEGHELIGKQVEYTAVHKMGFRHVSVSQIGTVHGWISETDTDRQGNPGFVCNETGKPSNLFHIVFDDAPHHPYAKLLIDSQDMEEGEVRRCLLNSEEPEQPPPTKRARTAEE